MCELVTEGPHVNEWLFIGSVVAILSLPGPTNTLLAAAGLRQGVRRSLPLIAAELGGYLVSISVWGHFLVQADAVIVTVLWSAVATFAITKVAGLIVGLRVDRDHEIQGLDFATHGESAYHSN